MRFVKRYEYDSETKFYDFDIQKEEKHRDPKVWEITPKFFQGFF